MAEQTQTEKLRETFLKIVLGNKFSFELADELVRACKEAGLMFTKVGVKGDLEGACICKVGEIEI